VARGIAIYDRLYVSQVPPPLARRAGSGAGLRVLGPQASPCYSASIAPPMGNGRGPPEAPSPMLPRWFQNSILGKQAMQQTHIPSAFLALQAAEWEGARPLLRSRRERPCRRRAAKSSDEFAPSTGARGAPRTAAANRRDWMVPKREGAPHRTRRTYAHARFPTLQNVVK
jgi:hypothetical protein